MFLPAPIFESKIGSLDNSPRARTLLTCYVGQSKGMPEVIVLWASGESHIRESVSAATGQRQLGRFHPISPDGGAHALPPQLAHGNVTWLDRIWFTMGEICRSKKGVSFTFADALPFTLCISVHHKIVIIRVLYISLKPWHFNEKCHVERSSSPKMCAFKEQDNITVSHFNIFSVTYYGLQDRTQRC